MTHNPHYALFSNLQDAGHWRNTQIAGEPDSALGYNFNGGSSFGAGKNNGAFAMAVMTAVPEPEAYAILLAGLGLLGWRLRQRSN